MPEPGTSLPVVYLLRVVLRGISPLIWRRLLVAGDTSIAGLHDVLQVAFGWSGDHLHCFKVHGREYGLCYDGGPIFRDDARRVRLCDLGLRVGERFVYDYDLGALWRHDLRVEQMLGPETGRSYPRCAGGVGPARRRAAGGRRRSWRPASPIASSRW